MMNGATILITGGTGSLGQALVSTLFSTMKDDWPQKVIVFSRDEHKQIKMAERWPSSSFPIRYFLGSVRDPIRLARAFKGVDYLIHAAALKHVHWCEYNPIEAVRTNIGGAENVINAAIDAGVKKVLGISSDKAVNPINLYGATKLAADKLFIAANAYGGNFSVIRFGNFIGSSGSVIETFREAKEKGLTWLPITDRRMTRFFIRLDVAARAVVSALGMMGGGEVFIPKMPVFRIVDIADYFLPINKWREVGIRPGEKLHEEILSEYDRENTRYIDGFYITINGREHGYLKSAMKLDRLEALSSDRAALYTSEETWRELKSLLT